MCTSTQKRKTNIKEKLFLKIMEVRGWESNLTDSRSGKLVTCIQENQDNRFVRRLTVCSPNSKGDHHSKDYKQYSTMAVLSISLIMSKKLGNPSICNKGIGNKGRFLSGGQYHALYFFNLPSLSLFPITANLSSNAKICKAEGSRVLAVRFSFLPEGLVLL